MKGLVLPELVWVSVHEASVLASLQMREKQSDMIIYNINVKYQTQFRARILNESEMKETIQTKSELKPFLRACGPFRGGGSESDSDLEPDWDSEPERAGRGFSSSESLSATFLSDPEPESESESDDAF